MARYRVNLRTWFSRRRKAGDWLLPPLLLDLAPGAIFAYGLRRLRAEYTGKACNVRRGGDNATQDIGFDAFGNFDATGFATFVNGGNGTGFVATWYDQSGNGINATQATLAAQPQITFQLNGHACLTTAGFATQQYLATATNSLLDFTGTGHSVFYALQYTATTDGGGTGGGRGDSPEIFCHFNSGSFAGWASDGGDTGRVGCTFVFTSNGTTFTHDGASTHLNPINDGNQHFTGWTFSSGTVTIYQDTNTYTSGTTFDTPTSSGQQMTILCANDSPVDAFFSGNFGEGYGWSRTLTASEITAITSNAEAYFASLPLLRRRRRQQPHPARPRRLRKFPQQVAVVASFIPHRLKKLRQFIKRAPTSRRGHRFPAWLVQQGAYWISNTQARLRRRWRAATHPWRGNPRNPKLHRRVWDLTGDQFAYWISNTLARLKTRRQPHHPWRGNARLPRLHRFPGWLVQQGAYWITNALLRRKAQNVRKQPWRGPRKFKRSAGWAAIPPAAPTFWISNVKARLKARLRPLYRWRGNARKPAFHRRIWDLSGDQGPYWISNVLARLRRRWRAAVHPWRGNARRPQLHRFPAWLTQQGAYWIHRKKQRPQVHTVRPRRHRITPQIVTVAAAVFTPFRRKRHGLARVIRPQSHRLHRFPAWLVQQGASWISNTLKRKKAELTRKRTWRGPRHFHKIAGATAPPPAPGPTNWTPSRTHAQRRTTYARSLQRLQRPRSRLHYRSLGTYPNPGPPAPTPPAPGRTLTKRGPVNNIPYTIGVPSGAPNNQLATAMYLTQLVAGLNNWAAQTANAVNFSLIQGTPANSTSRGETGQIAFDNKYFYVCVAPNTWARIALLGDTW